MTLKVHVEGAHSHDVGDEIWQGSMADAIRGDAETVADYAEPQVLEWFWDRDELRGWVEAEMRRALVGVGDLYRAPDGVLYSLID
jgi:hypothetical protein